MQQLIQAETVDDLIQRQDQFFSSGKTVPYQFRKDVLKKLKTSIISYTDDLLEALDKDLANGRLVGFVKDVGVTIQEIDYILKNLKKWMKPKKKFAGLLAFPAIRAKIYPMPRGRTLIITPWNYPVLLTLVPLAYSIAAGNTAIVKPSEISDHTSAVISRIIADTFQPEHVACLLGGKEIAQQLIQKKYGLIYFIGSERVGRIIAEHAAKTLTPTVLELGGKSPTIVADAKHLKTTAKRVLLGKWVNAGQTCVAPDYVLVRQDIHHQLINTLIEEAKKMQMDNLGLMSKIVNETHFDRLMSLLDGLDIAYGGKTDENQLKIQMTIIDNPPLDHPIMQQEIFGPLLPIIPYKTTDHMLAIISRNPTPLALYIFSSDKNMVNEVHSKIQFGNGCINDTLFQFGVPGLPIGGVGSSGYGYNKGKESFDEFSRAVSILGKTRKVDTPFFYPPHTRMSKWLASLIFKKKI